MTDNRATERVDHPPRVREAIDELMREKDVADNRTTTEFIIDLSEVEKTSDRFKMLFNETVPLGKRIVRCRDCKFCMAYMAGTYCDYMAHSVKPDGFCAWAERKEVD